MKMSDMPLRPRPRRSARGWCTTLPFGPTTVAPGIV